MDLGYFVLGLGAAFAVAAAVAFSIRWLQSIPGVAGPIPVSHKIAVIGLPGAGKTTLITGLFELIQRGIHIDHVRLHGMDTIRTVNKYIADLNSQQRIGPTKENDIFVFRFSYVKKKFLLSRLYDVEIADFPGEYTELMSVDADRNTDGRHHLAKADLSNEFAYTLFNKEFFSWIASSREYLFLIDLSSIYSSENIRSAVAQIIARIRTSWQVIEDAISERGIGSPQHRQVHLIFTKLDSITSIREYKIGLIDLLNRRDAFKSADEESQIKNARSEISNRVKNSGAANDLSLHQRESGDLLGALAAENRIVFADLISFFQTHVTKFDVIYSSMTIVDEDGERLGVRRILEACLP